MHPRTLGLFLFAVLTSGCFVSARYGGGYYGYNGYGYRPVYTYQAAPAYQSPPTYTVTTPPAASVYAGGQGIVVAPGQNLVVPMTNIPVGAVQYVVVNTDDGRQLTL